MKGYTVVAGGSLYERYVVLRPNGSKLGGYADLETAVEAIQQDGGAGIPGEYFGYGRVWNLDTATGELTNPREQEAWQAVWQREAFERGARPHVTHGIGREPYVSRSSVEKH